MYNIIIIYHHRNTIILLSQRIIIIDTIYSIKIIIKNYRKYAWGLLRLDVNMTSRIISMCDTRRAVQRDS